MARDYCKSGTARLGLAPEAADTNFRRNTDYVDTILNGMVSRSSESIVGTSGTGQLMSQQYPDLEPWWPLQQTIGQHGERVA
jgi:hypothetical protein